MQVTTDVSDSKATLTINASIENKTTPKLPVKLQIEVLNANGIVVKMVSKNLILDKGINAHNQSFDIENPQPWMKNLYYQSSYDNATVRQSARKSWQRVLEFPYLMGQFRWTAFDYLGESNVWPSRFANFGVIDLCGFPKDHFYLYQSL